MKKDWKYGYKVCYKEYGKTRLKLYLVTNSFETALWHIRWCEEKPPPKIKNPRWIISKIKTFKEYNEMWKDCPF